MINFLIFLYVVYLLKQTTPQNIFPKEEVIKKYRDLFFERSECLDVNKKIPCQLWITGKGLSHHYQPQHLKGLLKRNREWNAHLIDDDKMHRFMKTVFNETRLLWAFEALNPRLGAAKSDIWRLAILWTYGGAYIDLDADLMTPLKEVMK